MNPFMYGVCYCKKLYIKEEVWTFPLRNFVKFDHQKAGQTYLCFGRINAFYYYYFQNGGGSTKPHPTTQTQNYHIIKIVRFHKNTFRCKCKYYSFPLNNSAGAQIPEILVQSRETMFPPLCGNNSFPLTLTLCNCCELSRSRVNQQDQSAAEANSPRPWSHL